MFEWAAPEGILEGADITLGALGGVVIPFDERRVLVLERAASARAQAVRLQERTRQIHEDVRAVLGTSLTTRTRRVDAGGGGEVDRVRIARLSAALGRDPAIEQAKQLLQDRHGITGAQAFELLRYISQNRNTKLRDVARSVIGSASSHRSVMRRPG